MCYRTMYHEHATTTSTYHFFFTNILQPKKMSAAMGSRVTSARNLKKFDRVDGDADSTIDNEEIEGSALSNYKTLMIEYPYMVNATQSAIISSCSVLVSQFIARKSEFDWNEVRAVSFLAAFWITPVLLIFYSRLQKMPLGFTGKLVVDQLIFSPLFTLSIITARLFLLQRSPMHEFPNILFNTVPKAIISSWTFWIPARAFTLLIVPPHLHLLTGSLFSFIWNVILSLLLNG